MKTGHDQSASGEHRLLLSVHEGRAGASEQELAAPEPIRGAVYEWRHRLGNLLYNEAHLRSPVRREPDQHLPLRQVHPHEPNAVHRDTRTVQLSLRIHQAHHQIVLLK